MTVAQDYCSKNRFVRPILCTARLERVAIPVVKANAITQERHANCKSRKPLETKSQYMPESKDQRQIQDLVRVDSLLQIDTANALVCNLAFLALTHKKGFSW